jgi:hypothetical protein
MYAYFPLYTLRVHNTIQYVRERNLVVSSAEIMDDLTRSEDYLTIHAFGTEQTPGERGRVKSGVWETIHPAIESQWKESTRPAW